MLSVADSNLSWNSFLEDKLLHILLATFSINTRGMRQQISDRASICSLLISVWGVLGSHIMQHHVCWFCRMTCGRNKWHWIICRMGTSHLNFYIVVAEMIVSILKLYNRWLWMATRVWWRSFRIMLTIRTRLIQ